MKRTLTLLSVFALLLSTMVLPAAADSNPLFLEDFQAGNADFECTNLGFPPPAEGDSGNFKFDPPDSGTVGPYTIIVDDEGIFFSWSSTVPVAAVIVKGGPDANAWIYDPNAFGDSGLYSPINNNGEPFELSHITFCAGDDNGIGLSGVITVEKTADTSFTRTHNWDIDKSIDPDTLYLYIPGAGPSVASATWSIDVDYLGFEDSDWKVSGRVTLSNTGELVASITEITDVITFDGLGEDESVSVTLNCDVDLPFVLAPGEEVDCYYEEGLDGAFDGENTATAIGSFLDEDGNVTGSIENATATVGVEFGGPTTEINDVVGVTDLSDTDEFQDFGSLDANDAELASTTTYTYTNTFEHGDFDECGVFSYDNTATLTSDDVELASDTATLIVEVQCEVFDGETAWAANGDMPGEFRYTRRGNWATYVEYEGAEKTTTMFAGQTIDVGSATFSTPVDGWVSITVELADDWEFDDVSESLKVQDYDTSPSGNPAPGGFEWKLDATGSSATIEVPENTFYGVHADVGRWIPDPDFGL